MSQIIKFNISEIIPMREEILREQGVSQGIEIKEKINKLILKVLDVFRANALPVGILSEISIKEFEEVFIGEGENAKDTPLENIFPQSDYLALVALTIGKKVSETISKFFKKNDFAIGSLLDSIATLASYKVTKVIEEYLQKSLQKKHLTKPDTTVLCYSPGYCGWHISGQRKLFQFLRPEKIGLSLNASFLMIPLKSVSGVIVVGKKEIHIFHNNYPFCLECKTHSCQARMEKINESIKSKKL